MEHRNSQSIEVPGKKIFDLVRYLETELGITFIHNVIGVTLHLNELGDDDPEPTLSSTYETYDVNLEHFPCTLWVYYDSDLSSQKITQIEVVYIPEIDLDNDRSTVISIYKQIKMLLPEIYVDYFQLGGELVKK